MISSCYATIGAPLNASLTELLERERLVEALHRDQDFLAGNVGSTTAIITVTSDRTPLFLNPIPGYERSQPLPVVLFTSSSADINSGRTVNTQTSGLPSTHESDPAAGLALTDAESDAFS